MPQTTLYSLAECKDLIKNCRLEELMALSSLLIEEWSYYSIEEQVQLLPALVKRRKELQLTTPDRKFIYYKEKNKKSLNGLDGEN